MERYRILTKGIVNLDNKYLLVERWYDDRIGNPFQWEFIDGEVIFGESPEKAVLRNIQEKTGLDAEIDRTLYTWSFSTGDVFNIGIAYLCTTFMDSIILSEDLNDYKWVEKDDLEKYIENPAMLRDLNSVDF